LGTSDWEKGSTAIFKSAYNEFPWYTNGVTGFVDVADVVKAMVALMDSSIVGEHFILNGDNIGYKEVFTHIARQFGKKPPHKEVTPTIAALVWRIEAIKEFFTKKKPLLTKETAYTAQTKVYFDNSKLLKALPTFGYAPIGTTIKRVCGEFKEKYKL
jgi:nucleoside-diphosphate-sugar epimerase